MVEKTTEAQASASQASDSQGGTQSSDEVAPRDNGPLVTEQGRTTIADGVVSKIAGIATREVAGVYDLGGGTARMVGALRDRIPGSTTNFQQGVSVEVGERQTAIDLDIAAEYGVSLVDLAAGIRRNVITAIERMTGLEVTEVNIVVNDVRLEGEDEDHEPQAHRVE